MVDRQALLPAAIEDHVAAAAPVWVINAFVDGLDVNGLGFGLIGAGVPTNRTKASGPPPPACL